MYFTKGSYNNNVPCRTWSFSFSWAGLKFFQVFLKLGLAVRPAGNVGRKPEDMGLTPILRVENPQMLIWLILTFAGHKRIYPGTTHFLINCKVKKKSALALMIWLHDHVSEYVEPHQDCVKALVSWPIPAASHTFSPSVVISPFCWSLIKKKA